MNRHTRQRLESIDRMVEALTALRRTLPELERRTRYAAGGDGYPGSTGGGASAGTISKPTERAALGRKPDDPVRRWSRTLVAQLDAAAAAIHEADNLRRLVFTTGPAEAVDSCVVCHEPEQAGAPLRDGRCPADYQYRRRNGVDRSRVAS